MESLDPFKVPYLKEFLTIQFGWHIHDLITQFEKYDRPNFYEMLLHHIVTIFVMIGSFFNNQYVIAGFILWIHDVSDFWLFIARISGDFLRKSEILTVFTYVMCLWNWFYFRIAVFPVSVLTSIHYNLVDET